MPSFHVQLRTDTAYATTTVTADSADDALDKVRAIPPFEFNFDPFPERRPVNEIIVRAGNGIETIWRDLDLHLRRAADDLLITAQNVLAAAAYQAPVFGWPPIMRDMLEDLREAVASAQGRNA